MSPIKTDHNQKKSYAALHKENRDRHGRVVNYLKVLKKIGLTLDQEEQVLVKRRVLQICLELEDMKDSLVQSARNILSMEEMDQLDDEHYNDPSVRFFGLEWRTVLTLCDSIYQDMVMFWAQLAEENTVDCSKLERTLAALDKLEHDVGNHALAVCGLYKCNVCLHNRLIKYHACTQLANCTPVSKDFLLPYTYILHSVGQVKITI